MECTFSLFRGYIQFAVRMIFRGCCYLWKTTTKYYESVGASQMAFVFMVHTLAMSWMLTARSSSSDRIIMPFVGRLLYIVAPIIANSLTNKTEWNRVRNKEGKKSKHTYKTWHLANCRAIFWCGCLHCRNVTQRHSVWASLCDTGVKVNTFKIATWTPFDLIYECISFHFISFDFVSFRSVSIRFVSSFSKCFWSMLPLIRCVYVYVHACVHLALLSHSQVNALVFHLCMLMSFKCLFYAISFWDAFRFPHFVFHFTLAPSLAFSCLCCVFLMCAMDV